MKCAGCDRELEVGDRYIVDTPSGFMANEGRDKHPEFDEIIARLFGGTGDRIVYCADCTAPGGDYRLETFYGEGDAA